MIKTPLSTFMSHLRKSKVNVRTYIINVIVSTAAAFSSEAVSGESIPYEQCFHEAGSRYSIEPALLMALADIESSFKPTAINARSSSDKDLGLMQIWTNWLTALEKYNITEEILLENPCVNIHIGAWILAENFASHGMNLTSLGAYNAGFSKKNEAIRTAYVEKVIPKLYHYRNIINARKLHD